MSELPRKWIMMDDRGRITIPDYMRKALGLPDEGEFPLVIEASPSLEKCTTIFIKKGQ